jgi:hypothetical protein
MRTERVTDGNGKSHVISVRTEYIETNTRGGVKRTPYDAYYCETCGCEARQITRGTIRCTADLPLSGLSQKS